MKKKLLLTILLTLVLIILCIYICIGNEPIKYEEISTEIKQYTER